MHQKPPIRFLFSPILPARHCASPLKIAVVDALADTALDRAVMYVPFSLLTLLMGPWSIVDFRRRSIR